MIETFDSMAAEAQFAALIERRCPPTSEELAAIARHASKAIARDLPEPGEVAESLPAPARAALCSAYTAQDRDNAGARRAHAGDIPLLFPLGLCDPHGYLTAFGMAVRRELLAAKP